MGLVGRVFPSVPVFRLCLGVLGVLGFFEVVYYPTIHRSTETLRFNLGFSLLVSLLALMVNLSVSRREAEDALDAAARFLERMRRLC